MRRAAAAQLIYSVLCKSAIFTNSLLLIVLHNLGGYLSDFDDDFEYDGRPYRFEPGYTVTDEELLERRMQKQREE